MYIVPILKEPFTTPLIEMRCKLCPPNAWLLCFKHHISDGRRGDHVRSRLCWRCYYAIKKKQNLC